MSIVLGVDPGVTGALAFVDGNRIIGIIDHSAWCNVHQPYIELQLMLRQLWQPDIVVIEQQHARPGQAVASTSNLMQYYGVLLGCLAAYDVPMHEVDPAVWKANMHLDKDKKKSLDLARKLWPNSLEMFRRIKDHGRAEAALIAHYGTRFLPLEKRRVL